MRGGSPLPTLLLRTAVADGSCTPAAGTPGEPAEAAAARPQERPVVEACVRAIAPVQSGEVSEDAFAIPPGIM